MEFDYPAAHSMDAAWFAVDKCGHVAVFWSGEDGAVPENAPDGFASMDGDWPFPGELDLALREGRIRPAEHGTKVDEMTERVSAQDTGTVVRFSRGFFLLGTGPKPDRSRIRAADFRDPEALEISPPVWGTADGRDWVSGYLHHESWAWLHEVPHRCLGCVGRLKVDRVRRREVFRIIRYVNDMYGGYPYEKTHNPENPATLPELQAATGGLIPDPPRFAEFCFRDKELLQPLQWFPCTRWGLGDPWIDEDRRPRNSDGTPGKEDDDGE